MKIRALVPFSTGTITMEQYEIKEVSDEVGARLVAAGLVTEISGGGGGSNALVVTDTGGTLDKTWQEIHDAILVGSVVIDDGTNAFCVIGAVMDVRAGAYMVSSCGLNGTNLRAYSADSASGYPYM